MRLQVSKIKTKSKDKSSEEHLTGSKVSIYSSNYY